jgi:hypothetical protein
MNMFLSLVRLPCVYRVDEPQTQILIVADSKLEGTKCINRQERLPGYMPDGASVGPKSRHYADPGRRLCASAALFAQAHGAHHEDRWLVRHPQRRQQSKTKTSSRGTHPLSMRE